MDGYGSGDRGGVKAVYRFLQRLFLEPDEEFCAFVLEKRDDLAKVGVAVDESLDHESLLVEYTRLFLGPADHTPPCESAFLEGRFWGRRAAAVKRFIESIGLAVTEDFKMPPDHIAVELEVAEVILASDHPEAERLYKRFFEEHLEWGLALLDELITKADLDFYKTSFDFARRFLSAEKERLVN